MKRFTLFDTVINEIQHGLNTCFIKPAEDRTYPPKQSHSDTTELSETQLKHVAGLMRVNNAGEVAAQGLYRGQALTAKSQAVKDNMIHASREENDHLNWCQTRLSELHSERSLLDPIWYIGSLKIGITAGLFGDKWSLGFVKETEKQVTQHLQHHLDDLPSDDKRTQVILEQMKKDEQQHADSAEKAGAAPLPQAIQSAMSLVSKLMTRTSYHI